MGAGGHAARRDGDHRRLHAGGERVRRGRLVPPGFGSGRTAGAGRSGAKRWRSGAASCRDRPQPGHSVLQPGTPPGFPRASRRRRPQERAGHLRGDRGIGRLDRRKSIVDRRDRQGPRSRASGKQGQGSRAARRPGSGQRPLPRLHRRRRRHSGEAAEPFPCSDQGGRSGCGPRQQAPSGLRCRLPAAQAAVLVRLPAADQAALPAADPGYSDWHQAHPARNAGGRSPEDAREAFRV